MRDEAGKQIFAALTAALAPVSARRPLAISFQIEEADPVLNYKSGNIRDYLAERGVSDAG